MGLSQPDLKVSELEAILHRQLLPAFFPQCLSEDGGFIEHPVQESSAVLNERNLVFQSRLIWTAAVVADNSESADVRSNYTHFVRHGLQFLDGHMFDSIKGTFKCCVDTSGAAAGRYPDEIHAYGLAFAIYALAAAYRVTGDSKALTLAQKTFDWLEQKHWDGEFCGYFEAVGLDGVPVLSVSQPGRYQDMIDTPYGWKSQNTHLHLLEAYTELLGVWDDPLLRDRLSDLLDFFLDRFYEEPGWLHVYVERDWRPVPGNASHGHDIEAAHLILAAAKALGRDDEPDLLWKCKAIGDFVLQAGWHAEAGAIAYSGTEKGIVDGTVVWWAAVEAILGFAVLYRRYKKPEYKHALDQQLDFVKNKLLVKGGPGIYSAVTPVGTVIDPTLISKWKCPYHDGRAFLFTSRILANGF